MIKILLNNEMVVIESDYSLDKLLSEKHYNNSFAIAINYNFIPRSEYKTTLLKDGDKVEVVAPMQGG